MSPLPPPQKTKNKNSAGAARVDAVESVGHVAAAAERVVAEAGGAAAARVRVLHKDARFLAVGRQPDGQPGDLDAGGADVVVFEVRAGGCRQFFEGFALSLARARAASPA